MKRPGKTYVGPVQSDLREIAIQKDTRNLVIVIEGKVYAAPTVKEKIRQGKCMISGDLSKSEVSRLKELLEKQAG